MMDLLVMNSPSFCLSENVLVSVLPLRDSFIGYRTLVWYFFFSLKLEILHSILFLLLWFLIEIGYNSHRVP